MVDSASAPPPEPAVEFTDTGVSTGIEAEDIGEAGRMPFDPELIDVKPEAVGLKPLRLQNLEYLTRNANCACASWPSG